MSVRKKVGIDKYKVTVREPSWERATMLWEEFSDASGAEDFIKDIASTYPEGTLLWVTAIWSGTPSWAPRGMTTRKSFAVNGYGEAVRRKAKWVPDGMVAREWIGGPPEVEIPPEPIEPEISRGLGEEERRRLEEMLSRIAPEEAAQLSYYDMLVEERGAKIEQAEEFSTRDYFRPEELRSTKETLRKILGEVTRG